MSQSMAPLYTILPWNFITKFHEGVVVQKDGLLQRTFAYRAPDTDSSSDFEINHLCVQVNDFAKRLGQDWAFFIEAQRFCTTEYPKEETRRFSSGFDTLASYLIEKEREEAFSLSGSHFESSYYLTFTWKPPSQGVKKLTSMFIQSGIGGDEAKSIKENVEYFVGETDTVIGLLGGNMFILPLNNEQTVAYLHSTVSFNRHHIHFPCTQILLDRILPDSELINSLTMQLGGYYIPIIGINDFPEETYPAIFEHLNRTRMEYRWVTRYICLSKEEAKKEAQKKEKAHRGARKTFLQTFAESTSGSTGGSTVYNHGAGVKEQDSIEAGVEIETDVAALGYYTSCVMVWDTNYESAKKKADLVRNIINSAGFSCKEETFNALESWKSMLPGQIYANYRSLLIMSYNYSHVVPLSSVWSGLRVNDHAGRITGIDLPHITCSTQEGTPFYLNLNPGGDVGHTAIWGPTGAGKSTLLNLLEAQFYRYPNSQIIVFDKDRSCRQICLASGGLFFEPASEGLSGVAFQPLRELETDRDMMDAMDFIESLCTVNGNEVSPPMRSAIKECLDLLRDKDVETRTLTSFVQYCNYMDPETRRPVFKEILGDYLWSGGKFGKIFDSSVSGISLDARFLAFEMADLMNRGETCIVPALIYLFNVVEKKFTGNLTLLILDEAWLFLKHETFSQKIAEWLKVLRKKNVFVVFATQDVADVEKSPLKTTIIQQCLTKIYLADPSAITAGMLEVYRAFGLTDTEIDLISQSRMKRDYFYTSPLGRRLFQLDLGRLTLSLIGAPKHALLDKLVAEKGSGVPLCRDILKDAHIEYGKYMGYDAPEEKEVKPVKAMQKPAMPPKALPPEPVTEPGKESSGGTSGSGREAKTVDMSLILDAVTSLPARRKKGEGRAAESLARRLGVGVSTVYQAQSLIRHGDKDLIERVRKGEITVKKACKVIREKEAM